MINPQATNPFIANLTLTLANTEYSQVLPDRIKAITIKLRNKAHTARFGFKTGAPDSATGTYITIGAGDSPFELNVNWYNQTLYFESPDAGAIVEIWAESNRYDESL